MTCDDGDCDDDDFDNGDCNDGVMAIFIKVASDNN